MIRAVMFLLIAAGVAGFGIIAWTIMPTETAVAAAPPPVPRLTVIVAARLSGQARGGEILVSSLVREIVEPRGDVQFAGSRTVTLKGLSGSHLVHAVRW